MHADASHCWFVSYQIQSSTVFVFGMTQAASKAVTTVTRAESAAMLQAAMSSQNQDLAATPLSHSAVERPRPRYCHPWACSTCWQSRARGSPYGKGHECLQCNHPWRRTLLLRNGVADHRLFAIPVGRGTSQVRCMLLEQVHAMVSDLVTEKAIINRRRQPLSSTLNLFP